MAYIDFYHLKDMSSPAGRFFSAWMVFPTLVSSLPLWLTNLKNRYRDIPGGQLVFFGPVKRDQLFTPFVLQHWYTYLEGLAMYTLLGCHVSGDQSIQLVITWRLLVDTFGWDWLKREKKRKTYEMSIYCHLIISKSSRLLWIITLEFNCWVSTNIWRSLHRP